MRIAALALLIPAAVAAASCGKKGPPLPPLRSNPEAVERVGSRQVGDMIILSFPRPKARTDGTPLGPDTEIELLMVAREPAPRRVLEIEQHADVTWSIPRAEWDAYRQGDRMEMGLSLARISAGLKLPEGAPSLKGRKLSFLLQVVEGARKRSAPSEIETLTVCDPPGPPSGVVEVMEDGLRLTWSSADPADGSRFNVYRQDAGGSFPAEPLPPALQTGTTYLDATAVIGKAYRYVIRSAQVGGRCESADSPALTATRVDHFPPAAPEGLAAVAESGAIRLFWRPNREPDLHGYRVYRSELGGEEWKLLTPEEITATSFTDRDVSPGVVYSYAVTALDGAVPPNESGRSEPAVETAEAGK